jgi:hypothetical protein
VFAVPLLFVITLAGMWNHDPGWFFASVEILLKANDRANLGLVRNELGAFGRTFAVGSLLSAAVWFWLARCLWTDRIRAIAYPLILISILLTFVSRAVVMPVIAQSRSYRPFMEQVNQLVKPGDKLYVYNDSFNSDQIVFYRGAPVETLQEPAQLISDRFGSSDEYVIMAKPVWREISAVNPHLPLPLLQSEGSGPEGDAPLVLIKCHPGRNST